MPELPSGYTSQDILRAIEQLGKEEPWFHCIDLGAGIQTMREPLPHLQKLWDRIAAHITDDFTGKSVLDIGCNAGFFSVQAKKHHADYVLGIDLSDGFLKQAEFVKSVLGLEIDYRKMSVFEVPKLGRTFDIVFCLGVIYHCAHPFEAARCVESVTGSMAIVESAAVDYPAVADRPLWEFVFPGHEESSAPAENDERCYNWWFPNKAGLRTLFLAAGFREVQPVFEVEDRVTIACYK